MGERCPICKMDVTSLQIHWRINHRKRKFTKGEVNLGFKATGRTLKKEELIRCPACDEEVRNLDQHTLLAHPPARTARTTPGKNNRRKSGCHTLKFKDETIQLPQENVLERLKDSEKFLKELVKEKSSECIQLKGRETYKQIIFNVQCSFNKNRVLNCPECEVELFKGVINNRMDKHDAWNWVSSHLEFCASQDIKHKNKGARVGRNYRFATSFRHRIKIAICGGDERKIKELVNWHENLNEPRAALEGMVSDILAAADPTTILNVVSFLKNDLGLNISVPNVLEPTVRVDGVVSPLEVKLEATDPIKIDEEPPQPVKVLELVEPEVVKPEVKTEIVEHYVEIDPGAEAALCVKQEPMDSQTQINLIIQSSFS